jgi:hypothetical protein
MTEPTILYADERGAKCRIGVGAACPTPALVAESCLRPRAAGL